MHRLVLFSEKGKFRAGRGERSKGSVLVRRMFVLELDDNNGNQQAAESQSCGLKGREGRGESGRDVLIGRRLNRTEFEIGRLRG